MIERAGETSMSLGVPMTAMERSRGRYMRAPDHTAAGDSGQQANNGAGNSGSAASGSQGENNSGLSFSPDAFWSPPSSQTGAAPAGGSAAAPSQGDGGQGGQQQSASGGSDIGQRFAQQLSTLAFPTVFNQETATQIADGNLDGINQALAGGFRDVTRQAVLMSAQLMQAHSQHLMSQVETLIQERLGSRDADASLMQEFPQAARDPAIRPVIQNIFAQSMKHTGGNREKAIAMTRDMLKYVSTTAGRELGLGEPPGNPGDNLDRGAQSLVEQLLAR